MADVLVSGDTAPTIYATLHDEDDATQLTDLTGATVHFQMRRLNDRRLMIHAPADIVTAASGEVMYELGSNDLAIPGDYVIEWQVVFPDGKKQTTANLHAVEVRRR